MKYLKGLKILLVIGLIISLMGLATTSHALRFMSFGTGSPAGTYYFLGAGFASIINKYVPGVRVTAESTAASLENCRLMIRGQMDMGLACMGSVAALKKAGMDVNKIRLIAIGHTSDVHWIVRKESPIKKIEDFRGRVIGVGPAGSATLNIVSKKHLKAGWGLTFKDFKPKYLSFTEICTGIRDSTINAGVIFAGYPIASIMELSRDVNIRLIPISPEEVARLKKVYANVVPMTIPAGTYHGIDKPVPTYSLPQMWLCRADLPTELVYEIIKAVYGHPKEKNAIHPMAKRYTIQNAFKGYESVPVGYHPGAIKYYKEKGIWDKRNQYK
jgi:TRAP transporter TAXI family solute receptor